MIPKDGVLTARFPRRFFTLTMILTGSVLVWLGWAAYRSFRVAEMTWQRDFRIEELRGTIIHLDEVLTMSARMAVATGEQQWEAGSRLIHHTIQHNSSVGLCLAAGVRHWGLPGRVL